MAARARIGDGRHCNPSLGELIDVFSMREYFGGITTARDVARKIRDDVGFLAALRRSLVKLPFESSPRLPERPWWPPATRRPSLRRARLGIVASGGSGALASLVGALQACDELGLRPQVMSFASGAALFGFPIAAGRSPREVADFVMTLDPTDWIDINWTGLAGILATQGCGFAGVMKGDKLEASYESFLGNITLGELRIPAYVPVWNVEHNQLEYVGPSTHPELTVSRAIRMAVSLPLFVEPVSWRGGSWCDGGIVDIFPVRPVLDLRPPCDAVLALNCFYLPGFTGEDACGWRARPWSVLDLADQVVTAQHIEIARDGLSRLQAEVGTVMMIDPVPYELVRRAGFYAQFLDHAAWPEFMRSGRRAALTALRRGLRVPATNRNLERSA